MGKLILVRHGQASFLAQDYDQLSEKGYAQSRLLGQHLAESPIDAVYIGPRRRHRQTYEAALEGAGARGASWPDPIDAPDFDEHRADVLIKTLLPDLIEAEPELAALARQIPEGGARAARAFQLIFEDITARWVRKELSHPGLETWAEFRARVERGVKTIVEDAAGKRGQTVVAFTSAGSVAASAGYVLGLDDHKTLEMGWVMYNASISEILFSTRRTSWASQNRTPHLPSDMLTYR